MPNGPGGGLQDDRLQAVGNTATYKLTCTQPVPMNMTGEMRYAGTDAYTGTVTMDVDGKNMAMSVDAKRLGDCPK